MTRTEPAQLQWENDFVPRPNFGDVSAAARLCRRGQLTGLMFAVLLAFAGCGGSSEESDRDTTSSGEANGPVAPSPQPLVIKATPLQGQGSGNGGVNQGQGDSEGDGGTSGQSQESGSTVPLPPRTLGDLIKGDERPFESRRMEIDEERVATLGILTVKGKYLHLYSDVRNLGQLRELVSIFDAAVPWWCERFEVPLESVEDWYVTGILVQDPARLRDAGLFPADLPPFPNGYSRGFEFWFYQQPSDFYLRYLMLHEGTHAFMQHMLKGRGAPWYSEGMAEYIAVHNWTDGKLQMQQVIERRQDAPLWGRVKIVRDDYFAEKALMPEDIMLMEDEAFLKNAAYGWSWALCHFLDHHPDYKTAFAALQANVKDISPAFAAPLLDELEPVWPRLREDWQLFIGEIDYGYDVERAAVVHRPVEPLDDQSHTVDVLADRGWQSSGLYIEAGQAVEITASGQFIVKSGEEEWPSEPGGITISYYRGRPLGELHAAIREDRDSLEMLTPLLAPVEVGTGQVLRSERGGVLFLRINDNPNSLADNQGKATVNIRRAD